MISYSKEKLNILFLIRCLAKKLAKLPFHIPFLHLVYKQTCCLDPSGSMHHKLREELITVCFLIFKKYFT